ncbi:hypothetical protein HOC13_01370 [Candidatus Woesearchaeota archaeon]|jgi:uncharacterized membrane protein|nr:hypothetical protein [Candidatus Woesearchaeota archaeon]
MKTNHKIFFVVLAIVALLLTTRAALADSDYTGTVFINEFSTNPDGIELYNAGETITLNGWTIEDDNKVVSLTGIKIKAGKTKSLAAILTLNNVGEKLILKDSDGNTVDDASYGEDGDLAVPGKSKSLGRQHDGSSIWKEFDTPTLGSSNGNANEVPEGTISAQKLEEVNTEEKTLNLTNFITDADGDILAFTGAVATGGITCAIDGNELTLSLGNWEDNGKEGTCTFTANDGYEPTEFTVDATITSALTISGVKVNGDSVTSGEESTPVNPLEEVSVQFTVKNNLEYMVTGITAEVSSLDFTFEDTETFNLNPGASQVVILKESLSYEVPEGKYDVNIKAEGKDYMDKSLRNDLFDFVFVVEQEPADIVISNLKVLQEELTCKEFTKVVIEYTNAGDNIEDDVHFLISSDNEVIELDLPGVTINPNEVKTKSVKIYADELTEETTNTISVKALFRDDSTQSTTETVDIKRNSCIEDWTPETDGCWAIADGIAFEPALEVTLAEEGYDHLVTWYNSKLEDPVHTGSSYEFSPDGEGAHYLYAAINGEETEEWCILVSKIPIAESFETNIPADATDNQLEDWELVIENDYGKVEFGAVDLRDLTDLDEVIELSEHYLSIDTSIGMAEEFTNVDATITFYSTSFSNPVILKDNAVCEDCVGEQKSNTYVFTTFEGFSTYEVVDELGAGLTTTDKIEIEDATRETTFKKSFTVKNKGTLDSLTETKITSAINNDYQVKFSLTESGTFSEELNLGTLDPLEEVTAWVSVYVPEDADGKKDNLGDIKVEAKADATTVSSTIDLYLQAESDLIIEDVEVNGKSSGKFYPGEENEIEVNVKNTGNDDLEDVFITITIKNIDDDEDDLEEISENFDLDDGDDHKETIKFTLPSDLEEDEYELIIEVEGETSDGAEHADEETKDVGIERDSHNIVISSTSLVEKTYCNEYVSLSVLIKNIGTKDEDDVSIRVKNTDLGINLEKKNLKLEDYSDNDNDDTLTFTLDVTDAKEGEYTIEVEVYRDDILEDTEKLTLNVGPCESSSTADLTTPSLTQQIIDQLKGPGSVAETSVSGVTSSFRESNTYVALLGVLVILILVAVGLGVAVVTKKRK